MNNCKPAPIQLEELRRHIGDTVQVIVERNGYSWDYDETEEHHSSQSYEMILQKVDEDSIEGLLVNLKTPLSLGKRFYSKNGETILNFFEEPDSSYCGCHTDHISLISLVAGNSEEILFERKRAEAAMKDAMAKTESPASFLILAQIFPK